MRYRSFFPSSFILATALLATTWQPPAQQPAQQEARVIEVTATRYQFDPAEIRVKKGEKVQLKVRAVDRTHGLEFKLYPDGAREEGPTGLRFESDQHNWKLEKEQERVIELTAERAGTYTFKCSVYCGWRHLGMKGKLIVEE